MNAAERESYSLIITTILILLIITIIIIITIGNIIYITIITGYTSAIPCYRGRFSFAPARAFR